MRRGGRPRSLEFYVLAAGPTLDTNFHVVGTILDRAWVKTVLPIASRRKAALVTSASD